MIATLLTAAGAARQKPATDLGNSAFEGYIELLRQQASIPALSGVLIQDRVIAWERGLGFANLESRVAARSDTPYAIGDLTDRQREDCRPTRPVPMMVIAGTNDESLWDDGIAKAAAGLTSVEELARVVTH